MEIGDSMPHSPELWKYSEDIAPFTRGPHISDTRGHAVVVTGCDDSHDAVEQADAKRIVACVNACAGWTTEELADHSFLKVGEISLEDSKRDIAHLAHLVKRT